MNCEVEVISILGRSGFRLSSLRCVKNLASDGNNKLEVAMRMIMASDSGAGSVFFVVVL